MLQHMNRQVELFEMHCFTMFITALCVISLSIYVLVKELYHEKALYKEFAQPTLQKRFHSGLLYNDISSLLSGTM